MIITENVLAIEWKRKYVYFHLYDDTVWKIKKSKVTPVSGNQMLIKEKDLPKRNYITSVKKAYEEVLKKMTDEILEGRNKE